jgi:hypothetical protein
MGMSQEVEKYRGISIGKHIKRNKLGTESQGLNL